ncbi:hypothetical protein BU17DRAFT_95870 [Hysterangium stoloniferum]|nr:hypothetical protein BU17DRAFT_95870 [Hysterangium stoloniferum]
MSLTLTVVIPDHSIGSGLAILSAIITFFFLTPIPVDGVEKEDADFREYLVAHGYDVSQMGLGVHEDGESDRSISDEKAAA